HPAQHNDSQEASHFDPPSPRLACRRRALTGPSAVHKRQPLGLSAHKPTEELRSMLVIATPEPGQRGNRELSPKQRHALAFVQIAGEPPQRRPLDLRRLIRRVQQDQLQRLLESERELPRPSPLQPPRSRARSPVSRSPSDAPALSTALPVGPDGGVSLTGRRWGCLGAFAPGWQRCEDAAAVKRVASSLGLGEACG